MASANLSKKSRPRIREEPGTTDATALGLGSTNITAFIGVFEDNFLSHALINNANLLSRRCISMYVNCLFAYVLLVEGGLLPTWGLDLLNMME